MHLHQQYGAQLLHNLRFDIRAAIQTKYIFTGSADAKPAYDSIVEISFMIGERQYGRYSTGVRTFRRIWDGRKALRVAVESRALIQQLAVYQQDLERAYAELAYQGEFIDGQTVLKALKNPTGCQLTLSQIYQQFLAARRASLEPQRRLRKEGQIAPSTLRTYPKRWAMIELYLTSRKRTDRPISTVDYGFATDLKEFLTAYKTTITSKPLYGPATTNKAISLLKMLLTYAQSKGYVRDNPIRSFSCRGGSPAAPKPLTETQLMHLETCELPVKLRLICDSWLIAGELCLHHADYMQLPSIKFIRVHERMFIQHERSKQQGSSLKQTVNLTPRALRLLAKYDGPEKLFYAHSGQFSTALKQIAMQADLQDENGQIIALQFGQGRDSGLTDRARKGANGIQLSLMAGWSNPRVARRYLGDDLGIINEFAKSSSSEPELARLSSFTHLYKAS